MGNRVCCREGVSLGFNSEAPPAPMILSNSLFPDVAPQMMAGIIMAGIIMMVDDGSWTWKIQLASPFGQSGEMCEEHLAFDSFLGSRGGKTFTHLSFCYPVEKENIFPMLWFCLGSPQCVVW